MDGERRRGRDPGRSRTRCLLPGLLLLGMGCQTPGIFLEGATVGVVASSPKQAAPAIFFNSYTGEGIDRFPDDQWATVDVSGMVPAGTKAVYLSGILIITHGTTEEICDLTLAYRNLGETGEYSYIAQTIEASVNGGQRTPHSIWVPARDGHFQIRWHRSTMGTWPDHCAYGINLNLVGYLR